MLLSLRALYGPTLKVYRGVCSRSLPSTCTCFPSIPSGACQPGQFDCTGAGTVCVSQQQVCDGQKNCAGGQDESPASCGKSACSHAHAIDYIYIYASRLRHCIVQSPSSWPRMQTLMVHVHYFCRMHQRQGSDRSR